MDEFSLTLVTKMPRSKDMTKAAKDAADDDLFQCECALVTSSADLAEAMNMLRRSAAGFKRSVRGWATPTCTHSPDLLPDVAQHSCLLPRRSISSPSSKRMGPALRHSARGTTSPRSKRATKSC